MTGIKINYAKAVATLVLAVYGMVCAADVTDPGFLDNVDLVAHEAGHLFFSWFGEFLQAAGGTLGQLFVPLAFTVYFFLRSERFSASVALFWAGQNLFNISVYIQDAQTMELPLVSVGGGEDAIHDWNYLLSQIGLLRWDRQAGTLTYLLGLLVMIASIIAAAYWSVERQEKDTPH